MSDELTNQHYEDGPWQGFIKSAVQREWDRPSGARCLVLLNDMWEIWCKTGRDTSPRCADPDAYRASIERTTNSLWLTGYVWLPDLITLTNEQEWSAPCHGGITYWDHSIDRDEETRTRSGRIWGWDANHLMDRHCERSRSDVEWAVEQTNELAEYLEALQG